MLDNTCKIYSRKQGSLPVTPHSVLSQTSQSRHVHPNGTTPQIDLSSFRYRFHSPLNHEYRRASALGRSLVRHRIDWIVRSMAATTSLQVGFPLVTLILHTFHLVFDHRYLEVKVDDFSLNSCVEKTTRQCAIGKW